MKYLLCLLFLGIGVKAQAHAIEGTFSVKDGSMICRGSWDHPFLPRTRNFNGRIPSGPLLGNEIESISLIQKKSGVKISAHYQSGKVDSVTSFQGVFRGIKVYEKDHAIIIKQFDALEVHLDYGHYVGLLSNSRFKASLSLTQNNDLLLENFYAHGKNKLVKKISCVLPRI
jgi:hypothetical protein